MSDLNKSLSCGAALGLTVGLLTAIPVFAAGEVSSLITSEREPTPFRYESGGTEYTWGLGMNQLLEGFVAEDRAFGYAQMADRVELQRDDVPGMADGEPCGVFVERLDATSTRLAADYPQDTDGDAGDCDMTEVLVSRVLNRGTLDLFSNKPPDAKNIERVDYLFDSGILAPVTPEGLAGAGHVVAEKGGNNRLKIAAVLSVDMLGQPASYGRTILVREVGCMDPELCYGTTDITHDYAFFRNDSQAPQGLPTDGRQATESVAMAFVSTRRLGLKAGQRYFGFSLFADDVDTDDHDLLDPSTFPDDTQNAHIAPGDAADVYGGLSGFFIDETFSNGSGRVFLDEDGDGLPGETEAGIADIQIQLYRDTDGDGVFDPTRDDPVCNATDTDLNGGFVLPGLPDGDYFAVVRENDPEMPAGLVLGNGRNPLPFSVAGNDVDNLDFPFTNGGSGPPGGVDAGGADAGGADAGGADAGGADAGGVDAGGADAGGADAGGVDAGGADAGGADAGGADAGGADAGGADAGGADAGGADAGGADAGGADAGGADAGGADAGGADAGGADAGGADAGGADAGGADAGGADAGGADAGSADAGGADAGGADSGGADAGGADAGTADAGGADAGGADAGGADAGSADAGSADTGGADTGGADAGGADAGGADAGDADAGGADAGGADAGGVDAGGADAGGADAGGADAGGADAGGVDAGGADAGGADSGGTDAGDADAGGADAGGTDAGGADAGGADTGAADGGTTGISDPDPDASRDDSETRAEPDSFFVRQGESATVNVIANDGDAVGTGLTVIRVGETPNATIEIIGNQVVYTPDPNFYGTDAFVYEIRDAEGTEATGSAVATVLRFSDINNNGENDFAECDCTDLTLETGVHGSGVGRFSLWLLSLLGVATLGRRAVRSRLAVQRESN